DGKCEIVRIRVNASDDSFQPVGTMALDDRYSANDRYRGGLDKDNAMEPIETRQWHEGEHPSHVHLAEIQNVADRAARPYRRDQSGKEQDDNHSQQVMGLPRQIAELSLGLAKAAKQTEECAYAGDLC